MGKQKYAVEYTEVYRKIFLVEADSPEEAEEKMEYAAENVPDLTNDGDFDCWDIEVEREANIDDLERFDRLSEE